MSKCLKSTCNGLSNPGSYPPSPFPARRAECVMEKPLRRMARERNTPMAMESTAGWR